MQAWISEDRDERRVTGSVMLGQCFEHDRARDLGFGARRRQRDDLRARSGSKARDRGEELLFTASEMLGMRRRSCILS